MNMLWIYYNNRIAFGETVRAFYPFIRGQDAR